MLLISCNLSRACPKGSNLAEITQVYTRRVQLSNNQWESRPVWGSVYLVGTPLGENPPPLEAPIDLHTGDLVRVGDDFPERYLWDVTRKGAVAWSNTPLQERVSSKAADKDKVRAARRALE